MAATEKARMAEFEAEDDLRTLSRAEEIRAQPKRLLGARKILNKQARGLKRVRRTLGSGGSLGKGR